MSDKCYIITFQLLRDPSIIIAAIKSYGTWAKITDTTWAVVTTKSATDIRNHLNAIIAEGERIFVIKSGVEAAWHNSACTNEWLRKNL